MTDEIRETISFQESLLYKRAMERYAEEKGLGGLSALIRTILRDTLEKDPDFRHILEDIKDQLESGKTV